MKNKSLHIVLFIFSIFTLGISQNYAQTSTYDALGRMQSTSYPNGVTISYNYDAVGNRTAFNVSGAYVPKLVISEIMYDPNSSSSTWKWVEIYNADTFTVDLAGYVFEDDDGSSITQANILSGSIEPNKSAILYNSNLSASEFRTVWGDSLNLIPVIDLTYMSTFSDKVGLWSSIYSYGDGNFSNAIDTVHYFSSGQNWPDRNNAASIYLTDLNADNNVGSNWALSQICERTPVFYGYESKDTLSNTGLDIGSPGENAPIVTPTLVIQADNGLEHCREDTIFFSASKTATNDIVYWYINGLPAIAADSFQFTLNSSYNNAKVTAIIISTDVCSTLDTVYSDTLNIIVHPNWTSYSWSYICQGDSFLLPNGSYTNSSGTHINNYTTSFGCDSIHQLTLTVLPTFETHVYDTICYNNSYTLPSGIITNVSGTYWDTLSTAGFYSCDSIIVTHLTLHTTYLTGTGFTICQNDSALMPDGTYSNTAGTYSYTLSTIHGCDSFVNFTLTVLPVFETLKSDTICSNETYILPNGTLANVTGTYIDTLSATNGCDSIITTALFVNSTYNETVYDTICASNSYSLPSGLTVSASGIYLDTLMAVSGCDSIIATYLTVHPTYNTFLYDTICEDELYTLPDGMMIWNQEDTFNYNYNSVWGCDSLFTLYLELNNTYDIEVFDTICGNEVYLLPNGNTVTTSGIYSILFQSTELCDSLVRFNITVLPTYFTTVYDTICEGENFILPSGNIADISGVYIDTIANQYNCDSIIETHLWLAPNYFSMDTVYICEGDTFVTPAGIEVIQEGSYPSWLETKFGCDSMITSTLLFYPLQADTIYASLCENEFYSLPNGDIVSNAGLYIDTLQNSNSCDSVIVSSVSVVGIEEEISLLGNLLSLDSVQINASYQWVNCETQEEIENATDFKYIPEESGSYALVINQNTCIDTSLCINVNIVSVNNITKNNISVFPIPTDGILFFDLNEQQDQVKLEMYDILGKLIITNHYDNANLLQIDISEFASAVYTVVLHIDEESHIFKIIKE